MANEKISQFAIDADIEDVDGLAAMTITNAATADPAGGVPIEYGNVALPGYAFTLGNILKTKKERSDPDPTNWVDVKSNRIPSPVASGTTLPSEGITFEPGIQPAGGNWPALPGISWSDGLLTMQPNYAEPGVNFSGIVSDTGFRYPYFKVDRVSRVELITATTGFSTSPGIVIESNLTQCSVNEIEIYAGRNSQNTDSTNSIHIWNRNQGGNVKLESANDIFIETGVASSSSVPGASKKLYIKPANSTSITLNQVLTSMGTDGETEWQDNPDNNTEYDLNTTEPAGTTNVKVDLNDSSGTVAGSMTFEHGPGIKLNDNVVTGPFGSFSIDLDLANASGVGVLPIASGGTGSATAPMVGVITAVDKAAARAVLNVDVAGTDNSTNVTLDTSSYAYLSLSGQQITLGSISMSDDVSGELAVANGGTGATNASDARTNLGVDPAGTDNSTNVTLANTNYLTISGQEITGGTVPIGSGGTGNTAFASKSVVFSNGSELIGNATLEFTESPQGGGQASNAATLKIGFKDVSTPTDGYQGILKLSGQGDSSSTPYDESGKIELECQTGGHNFHIVGPDHSNMSYSPGIVLPDDIPKPGGTIVTSSIPPSSGSDRTVNTKWRKQNFHVISDGSGNNQDWDPSEHYNAKCDFTTSGTAQSLDLDTMLVTSGNFQVVFDGAYGTLIVINGASPVTITFPTNSLWVGGSSTVEPTASGVDIYSFVYDGSNFYWSYGLDNKS